MTQHHWVFDLLDEAEWDGLVANLDERQLALVESAVSVHTLRAPEQPLTFFVHIDDARRYPRTTGALTRAQEPARLPPPVGTVRAKARLRHQETLVGGHATALDSGERHIFLSPAGATDQTVRDHQHKAWNVRLYEYLEERRPLLLDRIRNHVWSRWESTRDSHHWRHAQGEGISHSRRRTAVAPEQRAPVASPPAGAPRAAIIGMHWLQAGGAEMWGIRTIRLVREAGLLPIVITDRDSHHPWITRSELEGALVLCLDDPSAADLEDVTLLWRLLENFDVRGVVIHHCQWLYERLPWLRAHRPELEIADSLHVLEFTGGFPRWAAEFDDCINRHHVISQQLSDWLIHTQGIEPSKVFFAPLGGLTTGASQAWSSHRSPSGPLTISYIGRFSRQKRPEAFLEAVRALHRAGVNVRAIVQGDGEMEGLIRRTITRRHLESTVEVRSSQISVSHTLAETDVLVITSSNEGITLTTFEAVAAGVPVISTDVGAQSEVIPAEALLPRLVPRMIPAAVKAVAELEDEDRRRALWEEESSATMRLATREDAESWMRGVIATWAQ